MATVSLALVGLLLGVENSDIATLYRFQAQVVVSAPAGTERDWIRVPVGPPMLEKLQNQATDFTMVDAKGSPVDWLWQRLDTPASPFSVGSRYVNAQVKTVRRRVDAKARKVQEVFQLTGPPAGRWRLQLTTPELDFVRQVELQGQGFSQRGDVFRMYRSGEQNLSIAFVQTSAAQGLTVTLNGDDGTYLEPKFRFVEDTQQNDITATELPQTGVKVLQRTPGLVVLELAEGVRPLALQFDAPSDLFAFRVCIADGDALKTTEAERLEWSEAVPLSRGAGLDRLQLPIPSEFQSRSLSVKLTEMSGTTVDKLQLMVRMPLVSAWVRLTAETASPLTVYGGSQQAEQRVNTVNDFLANLGHESEGARRLKQQLSAAAQVRSASLAEVTPNAQFRVEVPWTSLLSAGAKVDVTQFSHQRPLRLGAATPGQVASTPARALYEVTLSSAEVDIARSDLADVRLVDANGSQWPYVWAPERRPHWFAGTLQRAVAEKGHSSYTLSLAEGRLPLEGVRLLLPAGLAERSYLLEAKQGDAWRQVGEGTLKQSSKPSTVELSAARVVTGQLRLTLRDGDDAPLLLGEAELKTFPPTLWAVAESGNYQLFVGQPKLEAPQYDLRKRASFLAALIKQPVAGGPLQTNSSYQSQESFLSSPKSQKVGIYLVLGFAVALLGLLTFRVLKTAPTPTEP